MIYNFLLFIYLLCSLPKAIFDYIFYKKKKKDILKRLGLKSYKFNPKNKKPIIWIHAVSVGETKAATALLKKLKDIYPTSYIIISSTTQTGHIEAKKSLADKFIFFPFDFSFTIKKVFSQIKPDLLIFLETDFWYNFMKIAKNKKAKIVVASAKISKRSTNRFLKFLKFSKSLFSNIDLILAQNELYEKRFTNFVDPKKIIVSGNLKLASSFEIYSKDILDKFRSKLNIKDQKVITIASTHPLEEELLINELKNLSNTKILIAPRHPERFNSVYKQLKKITSVSLLSEIQKNQDFTNPDFINQDFANPDLKVILIDKMGILNILYQISTIAIVAGSFIDRVGGHNILEPVFVNTPVFFGPNMHSQLDLKKIVLDSNSGKQINLRNFKKEISKYLDNKDKLNFLINNCSNLKNSYQSILENTTDKITNLLCI
ncbi:MAG: 3-deoxy-D-manno-octulosonic acid transferase [Candidatus Anoxychlamydiales bacterium]|nr:3-deoxy-D-manno-octulosonic acid transferase [Candidatus Anoxychlamydiales bacterium]